MKRTLCAGCFFFIGLTAIAADACQVPVFRYALERWRPDPYEVLVLHRGELSAAAAVLVQQLEDAPYDVDSPANLEVRVVDLDSPPKEFAESKILDDFRSVELPQLVLRYPTGQGAGGVAWAASLSADNIARLLNSPARRTIAGRLLDGESAVWLLIESGDKQADDAAAKLVERELRRLAEVLELPSQEVLEADEFFRDDTVVELRLAFSLLRVRRDDPQEAAFISMILHSERDLDELTEPIVMPMFGRGRTYFALVGKGITPELIEGDAQFIIGKCSCQVKRDNPGTDMLLPVAWDDLVVGTAQREVVLPELTGLGSFEPVAPSTTDGQDTEAAADPTANDPATTVAVATFAAGKPVPPTRSPAAEPADSDAEAEAAPLDTLNYTILGLVFVALLVAVAGSALITRGAK